MALAALAGHGRLGQQLWADGAPAPLRRRRRARGHAVGNLVLTALCRAARRPRRRARRGRPAARRGRPGAAAVDDAARDRRRGRRPVDPDDPGATVEVRGQVAVATTPGQVVGVRLEPAEPPGLPGGGRGDPRGRLGGARAGVVVHQRHPAPAGARHRQGAAPARRARRLVALNLSPQPGETDGFSPGDPPRGAGRARARPGGRRRARRQQCRGRWRARESARVRGRARARRARRRATWPATTGRPRHDVATRSRAAYARASFANYGKDSAWR